MIAAVEAGFIQNLCSSMKHKSESLTEPEGESTSSLLHPHGAADRVERVRAVITFLLKRV